MTLGKPMLPVKISLWSVISTISVVGCFAQTPPATGGQPNIKQQLPNASQIPPEVAKSSKKFNEAIAAQQAGKYDVAIAAYQEVIRSTPNVYPAWFNMGLIQESQGKFTEASASYRKAAQLEPKNATPLVQLAIVLVRMKKYPEAEKLYLDAIRIKEKRLGIFHPIFV